MSPRRHSICESFSSQPCVLTLIVVSVVAAIAFQMFRVSNIVLTLVHLRIISAPLFAKLRIAFSAAVACARGTESAEPGGAERDEVVIYNDAVTDEDDAEGDGDVLFDGVATTSIMLSASWNVLFAP